jgi:hypothetical protein
MNSDKSTQSIEVYDEIAEKYAAIFDIDISSADIQAIEKYHFVYKIAGEDMGHAEVIYPIVFPEVD